MSRATINEDRSKGRISTERTIWCGKCSEWDQRPAERRLADLWRRAGWKLTRKHGWLCPNCAKES